MAQNIQSTLVSGLGANITVVPTITAALYAAGNCVGGLLKFDLSNPNQGDAVLQYGDLSLVGMSLFDSSKQDVPLNGWVFNKLPTGTYTDKTACTLAPGDFASVVGLMQFSSYTVDGANSVGYSDGVWSNGVQTKQLALNLNNKAFYVVLFIPNGGTAPTYTSASNLTVNAQVLY